MNMRNIFTVVASVVALAACGGGGGDGGNSPATATSTPQNAPTSPVSTPASTPPGTSAADLALAERLYKGDARTPADFEIEARPASVLGTLSTRHLRNTDFATGPQSAGPTYEVCTNDMAQAIDWSERLASWSGQYSDLVEVRSDQHMFEVIRVPRADVTAMLRHRVFKCDYLDRSGSDLRAESGAAGAMNQRPLTPSELRALSEYLWQFTLFNNSDYAVASSSTVTSGNLLSHSIRLGQMVRGANGACDTVQISDWTHTMDPVNGALARSLTGVRSYQVRNSSGVAQSCSG